MFLLGFIICSLCARTAFLSPPFSKDALLKPMPRVSHMSASRTTANNDGVFGDDDEEESVGFCEPKPAAVATPSCHDGENMLPMMEHPEGNQRHAVKHQNRGPRNYWVAFTICSICGGLIVFIFLMVVQRTMRGHHNYYTNIKI